MIKILLAVLLVAAVLYAADRKGWLVLQAKRALLYTSSLNGKHASFSGCTGYTQRSLWFDEDKIYRFEYFPSLKKGTVSVEILGPKKQLILFLDAENTSGTVEGKRAVRYRMVVRFQGATGEYRLDWK